MCYRRLGKWMVCTSYFNYKTLRQPAILLQARAQTMQQTAEYCLQGQFVLVAGSLYEVEENIARTVSPGLPASRTVYR